jgi:hypothetical protein
MALEALAEAASVLAGAPLRQAVTVAMDSPIVIPSRGEAELRICAQRAGNRIFTSVRCADSSYATDHVRAEFRCDASKAAMPAPLTEADSALLSPMGAPGLVDGAELYGPIYFQTGRFRRISLLPEVTARSAYALAKGPDDEPWSAPGADERGAFLLGSPGLNDAVLQVLQACVPHRRLRPAGCASAQFSGRVADGPVEIKAIAVDAPGRADLDAPVPQLWNVEAGDGAGLLAAWQGVAMRDCGPLPRTSAWPPALLSAYLERRAADLGCGPDLRITVSCGLPDEALSSAPASVPPEALPIAMPPQAPPVTEPEPPSVVVPQQSPPVDSPAPRLRRQPRHVPKHAASSRISSSVRLGYFRFGNHASGPEQGSKPVEPDQREDSQNPFGQPSAQSNGGYTVSAAPVRSSSPLAGFGLTVHAAVPAACGWVPVETDRLQPLPPGTAHTFAQLRTGLAESAGTLVARLEAISACMRLAGLPEDARLVAARTTPDGWAVIDTGQARIATVVVEISGVPGPVAIGVLTQTYAGTRDQTSASSQAPGRDVVPAR